MARAAASSDVFHAIAEPRRRRILTLLADGEQPVTALAVALHLRQPQASKHLRVLRDAGLVRVRESGQQRLYRLNADALLPVRDWARTFDRVWEERLRRLDAFLDDRSGAVPPTGRAREGKA